MSGSIAAIAAYDGTGTQGYGTTDKSLPGVKSVFWNENDTDKYYVNGCSFSAVSSNKGEIISPETVIFTFDNDTDAINDLTLVIERKGKFTKNDDTPFYYMLYFVERIEVCIGNQVICTLNTAQLVKEVFDAADFSTFTNYAPTFVDTLTTGVSAQRINLNIFRMLSNSGMDSSYLMSCANNQTLQVKVYPQNFAMGEFNSYVNYQKKVQTGSYTQTTTQLTITGITPTCLMIGSTVTVVIGGQPTTYGVDSVTSDGFTALGTFSAAAGACEVFWYLNNAGLSNLTSPKFTFSLYANKYSMTNAERDFLRNQVVPKRTNITQYAELSSSVKPTGTLYAGSQLTINCDHFNLYTSNLYILALNHRVSPSNIGGFDIELYLNSTSYSGILPYSISFDQQNVWAISEAVSNKFFNYKIPIAKNAHMKETDQAYVPFSKFDSIRVVLTAKQNIEVECYKDFFDTLTVVAEGKCTALYQDGAVVFNNY